VIGLRVVLTAGYPKKVLGNGVTAPTVQPTDDNGPDSGGSSGKP
jgi:hypothetical protein